MKHKYFYSYLSNTAFSGEVGEHDFLVRCLPSLVPFQMVIEEHLVLPPTFWRKEDLDCWGNRIVYGGCRDWHRAFTFQSAGIVECEEYVIREDNPSHIFLSPTHLTNIPIQFFPNELSNSSPEEICEFVNHSMQYKSGSTTVNTTAEEALLSRSGVCQDFTHIMVGLCRANHLPARYVVGMMEGEGETHAWVEVWRDGVWMAFDPTHNCRISHGYIKIAHGRDASDCQVCRGLYKGQAKEENLIKVLVQEL